MALDPSIALAYRPPQVNVDVPNPIQQFGQVLSLRNMMQQGQLGQLGLQSKMLELDQLRRQMQEQQDYADAMKKYAAGAGSTTTPAGTAPVQPTSIVPPATPTAPAGASPTSLSGLMTPQAPAAVSQTPIAQAPAVGNPGLSRLGGMNAAQFISRFPLTGMSRIKEAFALDQAEAEAGIKQHDLYFKKADAMGRYAQAIKDSKDPAAQFRTSLLEAAGNGDLDPAIARQMIADGYEKHQNDIDAFIVKANNAKDYSEIQKNNLTASIDKRKLAREEYAQVNGQSGHDQFLARYPEMRPVLGDTFTPDVKDAFLTSPTERKDLPKVQMDAAVAAAGILEPARARGDAAFAAALAQFPKYIQDRYGDAKTPLEVRQRALTPEQATTAAQAATTAAQTANQTDLADLEIGGKPHKVLVNKRTGEVVKDLGESGIKPPQVNVNANASLLDRESARFAKSHEKAVADANSQLEKINDARAMINGPAEAQALGIPKVLTALVGGAGSGVRVTQPELESIAKARGIAGGVEGFINQVSGKGKLTQEQQRQLTGLLDDVSARIVQKQAISNDALDKINSAGSREEIVKIDSEARRKQGENVRTATSGTGAKLPEITSQAAYDALPKGAKYTHNGEVLTKK